jgi:hypothetical protein
MAQQILIEQQQAVATPGAWRDSRGRAADPRCACVWPQQAQTWLEEVQAIEADGG